MEVLSTLRDWCTSCQAYTAQFTRRAEQPSREVQVCCCCDRTTCDPVQIPIA